ncbi:MAG TPA: class I SAM-dependent methyltransferase, partial [Thermoanaerobaculia bacterium]|nr:class I SAM-dependent methyltransferase [Thermoanaerobaculia bacterium]
MTRDEVLEYLQATKGVEGWFFPIDALLFGILDEVQKREGIAGNLFEIGVHHGKTALFLTRMARAHDTVGVCDVFDRQELNRDRSGEGNLHIFLRHLAGAPVRIFAKLSSELTAEETTTQCRFVHIDGGHRPQDVIADLHTADRALQPEGVVAVDDVFNPNWPGVSEGFYAFLRESNAFVPIAIGGNKVLLARPSAAARYERHWRNTTEWERYIAPQPFGLGFKEWLERE